MMDFYTNVMYAVALRIARQQLSEDPEQLRQADADYQQHCSALSFDEIAAFAAAVRDGQARALAELGTSPDQAQVDQAARGYRRIVADLDAPERDSFDHAIAQYVIEMTPC